jgi:hypothetical protein
MLNKCAGLLGSVGVAVFLFQPSTAWAKAGPNLTIAMSHSGNFTVGVPGVYTIVVSNIGGASSSGQMDIFELFSSSVFTNPFTFVSAAGTGWSCSYGFISLYDEALNCVSSSVIAAGGSAAPITLTLIPCCSGTLTNGVGITGGGAGSAMTSDPTIVVAAVPALPQWAMIVLSVLLALAGVAAFRKRTT